ncbi:pseudouridine synthase [Malassezia pachydermatis]
MGDRMAAPGLRRLPPYWYEYKTRAKTRWYGRQILEVFTTEFRDRTKEYYIWAIHHGLCTVNGERVSPTYCIQNSDFIVNKVHRHEPSVTNAPVRILYRNDDEGRIVVVKPGSIPVHATGRYHHHTLVEMVKEQAHLPHLFTSNRLDRLTSGIMVCSTTKEAACELGNDFNAGLVNKAYVCRVVGRFPDGIVDCREPILSVDRQSGLNIVHPKGKECRTLFQRLSYDAATDSSVLLCRPITGRTHQIRVHAQWLGHAISNDPLYNHPVWNTVDRDVLATAQPRHYERVGGESGNVEVERVLAALKGTRDDTEGWARWRDYVHFGELNKQLGYEDIYVPGPNGEPAPAPPGPLAMNETETCDVCHIPLLPESKPEELYIYLHAIKYWTDAWVFQDELPWWASEQWQQLDAQPDLTLPDSALIAHHAGEDDVLGLGKGGAQRRVQTELTMRKRIGDYAVVTSSPTPTLTEMPPLLLEVPRGLEDAAQREILRRLPSTLAATSNATLESALHSGMVCVPAPYHAWALASYDAASLPVAIAAYWRVSQAVLPRSILDALFIERVQALGMHGPGHELASPLTQSEQELLSFVDAVWSASEAERTQALAAWQAQAQAESTIGRRWCVSVDRSSYVFPTLSSHLLESHMQELVAAWLDDATWTWAPRTEADLVIKWTLAPRFGVRESLQSGPRARQGNPSGTLFVQLQTPHRAPRTAEALRLRLAQSRAACLASMVPIAQGTHASALASVDAQLGLGLDAMLRSRGREPTTDTSPTSLDAALIEMPEKPREMPHAHLFDHYVAALQQLDSALSVGARALIVTSEPRLLRRALRELENQARRHHKPETLRLEPLVREQEADDAMLPMEDASTITDANEEVTLREGLRSFSYHHSYVAQVVLAPLFART